MCQWARVLDNRFPRFQYYAMESCPDKTSNRELITKHEFYVNNHLPLGNK